MEHDQYSGTYVMTGRHYQNQSLVESTVSGNAAVYWLRGTVDKNRANPVLELEVRRVGKMIQQYTTASDNTGTALRVRVVVASLRSTAIPDKMEDHVAIALPRRYLDAKKTEGLDIRLMGYNNVSLIVKVPPANIEEFLTAFDSAVSSK
jgi:hypothetical protein